MNYKHGHGRSGAITKTYRCWQMMHRRCAGYTPVHKRYYTDRGITVCARWGDFGSFLADMGEKPEGTTIDRINNNGNYEPGNCRWATKEQQMGNRSNAVLITHRGETRCVADWARALGIPKARIHRRLTGGWDPVEALSTEMFHERKGRRGPRT